MQNQGNGGLVPPEWNLRLKGAQFGFIAGIVIGLIFGWVFHGIISFAVRFGLLVVLLLPLVVIGWLWFRSQRGGARGQQEQGAPQGGGWATVIDVQRSFSPASPPQRQQPPADEPQDVSFVDVPLVHPKAEQTPVDIEAELEALKRESERTN